MQQQSSEDMMEDSKISKDEIFLDKLIESKRYNSIYSGYWKEPVLVRALTAKYLTPAQIPDFQKEVSMLKKIKFVLLIQFLLVFFFNFYTKIFYCLH